MKNKEIKEISKALRKIAWHFGSRGSDNECCEDLSMPEFLALEKIAKTMDCPINTVGSYLGFTKSGATRVVNRLERKGYVKKLKSPEDGRICCVTVTTRGTGILEKASQAYSERVKALYANLPEESAKQISQAVLAMAQIIKQ